jgi:FAD/FMN-containing dehydrogenase
MKDHYLTELSDAAIAAFISRGVADPTAADRDWTSVPSGGFQAYGGAIAETGDEESAFSHRTALIEWGGSARWLDPVEDAQRIADARAYGAAMEPFATGVYVNTLVDEGDAGVRRAYGPAKLARLAELKRRYDPENVFHLNSNIRPA